jgi:hypothetical protein
MQQIKTQERQNIIDVAIQYCGDIQTAFEIAKLNKVSLTEVFEAGSVLYIPDALDREVVNYYVHNNIAPATGITTTYAAMPDVGIVSNNENEPLITNNENELIIENNG